MSCNTQNKNKGLATFPVNTPLQSTQAVNQTNVCPEDAKKYFYLVILLLLIIIIFR